MNIIYTSFLFFLFKREKIKKNVPIVEYIRKKHRDIHRYIAKSKEGWGQWKNEVIMLSIGVYK